MKITFLSMRTSTFDWSPSLLPWPQLSVFGWPPLLPTCGHPLWTALSTYKTWDEWVHPSLHNIKKWPNVLYKVAKQTTQLKFPDFSLTQIVFPWPKLSYSTSLYLYIFIHTQTHTHIHTYIYTYVNKYTGNIWDYKTLNLQSILIWRNIILNLVFEKKVYRKQRTQWIIKSTYICRDY